MVFFKYLLLSLLTGAALISITAAEVANPGLSAHPLAGVSHELGKRQAISCPQGFRFTSGRCAGVSLPCVFMPARATSSSSKDDGHLINEVKSITHVSYPAVVVACPANARQWPACRCIPSFSGTITWRSSNGTWAGTCRSKCNLTPSPCAARAFNTRCGTNNARCTCLNARGAISCLCRSGFYLNSATGACTACAAACTAAQYERSRCTHNSNRVCTACIAATAKCAAGFFTITGQRCGTSTNKPCRPCTIANSNNRGLTCNQVGGLQVRATTLTGTNAFACNAGFYRVAANNAVTNSNDRCIPCSIANSNGIGISCNIANGARAQGSVANGFGCNIGFYFVDRPATGLQAAADTCAPCTLPNSNNRGVLCDPLNGRNARGDTSRSFLCNAGFYQTRMIANVPNLVNCTACTQCGASDGVQTDCTQTTNRRCIRGCTVSGITSSAVDSTACTAIKPGTSCTLRCATGAEPTSALSTATLTCPSTGGVAVSASAFVCGWRPCTRGAIGANVESSTCQTIPFGTTCTQTCRPGFMPNGNAALICATGGAALDTSFNCVITPCTLSSLTVRPNIRAVGCESVGPNGFCTLLCEPGFIGPDGSTSARLTCPGTGNVVFNAESFVCSRPPCGVSDLTVNANVDASACRQVPAGQSCTLACPTGFTDRGGSTLTCPATGNQTLSAVGFFCDTAPCWVDDGTVGSNVDASGCRNIPGGGTCTLSCTTAGYAGAGNAVLSCSPGGRAISAAGFECRPLCQVGAGMLPANVQVGTCGRWAEGTTCALSCPANFVPQGNPELSCSAGGLINPPSISFACISPCTLDMSTLEANVNGTNCTSVAVNQACRLACAPGWELDNDGLVRCTSPGGVISAANITCNFPCRVDARTVQPYVDLHTCSGTFGQGDTCAIKCISDDYVPPDYFQTSANTLALSCDTAGTQWDVSEFKCALATPWRSAKVFAAGASHACAIVYNDSSVSCWGTNRNFVLGTADTSLNALVYQPTGRQPLSFVTSGANLSGKMIASYSVNHTCAIVGNGGVRCWGTNAVGQLGYGLASTTSVRTSFAQAFNVELPGPAIYVATRNTGTCVVLEDGRVYCWGQTGAQGGFLTGDGTTQSVYTRPGTPVTLPQGKAIQVALGLLHSCALVLAAGTLATGQVYCWGINTHRALGLAGVAAGASEPFPRLVVLPYPALQVVATGHTTCALVNYDFDNVYCWGLLFDGQPSGDQPVLIDKLGHMSQISVGSRGPDFSPFICGINGDDGLVYCLGKNAAGQLGTGDLLDRPHTQDPVGLSFSIGSETGVATWLTTGDAYTCVQLRWGADDSWPVYFATVATCWGFNMDGRFGTGDADSFVTTPRPSSRLIRLCVRTRVTNGTGGPIACNSRDDALALYDDFGLTGDDMPNYCANDSFTLLRLMSPNMCCPTDNIMQDDNGGEYCDFSIVV